MPTKALRPILTLFALVAIFTIPYFAALWLFHHNKSQLATTNKGTLVSPPLNFMNFYPQTRKWTLILFQPNACGSNCEKRLHNLQQVHKLTGKDQQRINLRLLSFISLKQLDTKQLLISRKNYRRLIASNKNINFATNRGTIFIVDPHGNLMMAYQPNTKPMNIFKDLKQLLKVSQIG